MIAAIILYLIHAVLFGFAARRVAEYRQQPDGFWWGFWLGALGLLLVVFRPDHRMEVRSVSSGSTIRQSWHCAKCGARNPAGRENCQSCGASRAVPAAFKHCPSCGAKNKAANTDCFACGYLFEK